MEIERLQQALSYDSETGLLHWKIVRKAKGGVVRPGQIAGGRCNTWGYVLVCLDGKHMRAHRVAWALMTGAWPEQEIDHINGQRDDNRWSNLRAASTLQNAQNTVRPIAGSGLRGAYWHPKTGRWYSRIRNGLAKYIHLGYFDSARDASAAYMRAKQSLHSFQPVPRDV